MFNYIIGGILALGAPLGIFVGLLFAIPDFIRYRKIRAM
jgi:hypothetical protein